MTLNWLALISLLVSACSAPPWSSQGLLNQMCADYNAPAGTPERERGERAVAEANRAAGLPESTPLDRQKHCGTWRGTWTH